MNNMSQEKPTAKVIGQDINIFVTLGICSRALTKAGLREQAAEMKTRVLASGTYHEALAIMMDYVDME